MIAASLIRVEHVIAQAEAIRLRLPSERERVQRTRRAGREQMNFVAVALRLEELPNRANLHELRGLGLDLLDVVEQFERLRIAFQQQLFEISFEAEMPAVEHVR